MIHLQQAKASQTMAVYRAEGLARETLQQLQGLDDTLDVGDVLQAIRDIAEEVSQRLDDSAALGDILFTLNDYFYNVLDFHCSTTDQAMPQHSMLNRVLEQRVGEPLSLGILYICVGRWLGLPFSGCGFPGRFLVRYQDEQVGALIDPAAGGIQLQESDLKVLLKQHYGEIVVGDIAEGFLADVDDTHLVVRLLRRLKHSYLKCKEAAQALNVQERIMQLAPDMPSNYLERGRLYELLECPRAAAEDYSRYLDLLPDTDDVEPLQRHLSQLLRQPMVLH